MVNESGLDERRARLEAHWVYGGALAGLVLLMLMPALARDMTMAEALVFLALPAYMLHQYEEHDADRFRLWVCDRLADGREALTVGDVFIINVVGVWVVLALVDLLAFLVAPGWGIIAAYLLLINGAVHIAQALALRGANPGFYTSVLLFLPLGVAILAALGSAAGWLQHLVGLALVIGLHAAIVLNALRRLS